MRFLIVKTSSLGDIIHTFPVISFLKKKFPTAPVDWVVEHPFAELPQAHPQIDQVITIQSKKWRRNPFSKESREEFRSFKKRLQSTYYDVVFDFQGNTKSALVTFLAHAGKKVGFGKKTVAEWPNIFATNERFDPPAGLNIRDDYLFLPRSLYKDFSLPVGYHIQLKAPEPKIEFPQEHKILVCPGSVWPNKQLSTERLEHILLKQPSSHFYIAWGTEVERIQALALQKKLPHATLLDKMPLPQLQRVMSYMNLVVAVDSLPLHLAGTTQTATLSFFGPSMGSKYAPIGEQHRRIQGACPYGITFEKRCPKLRTCKTGACMQTINDQGGTCKTV